MELTDTLVSGYDLFEFLNNLADRCQELLEADEVTVVLYDGKQMKALLSSTERAHNLKLVEMQTTRGPYLECIIQGEWIEASLTDDETLAKWPKFLEVAAKAGYQRVLILPMRLRERSIGAMAVFRTQPEALPQADRELAQAFTDIATIAVLQQRASTDAQLVASQLQTALNSRIAIEQAKGILAVYHDIPLDEAFRMLRTQARNNNRRLSDLAHEIASQLVPSPTE